MSLTIELVNQCLQGYRRQVLRAGVTAIVVAICAITGTFLLNDPPKPIVWVPGLLLFFLGLYLLFVSWKPLDPARNTFVNCIQTEHQSIVWVYSYKIVSMPFGVYLFKMAGIYIHTRSKEQYLLRVPDKMLDKLMESLTNDLPHATFGHSAEKEQLYRANPDLLYRD